VREWRARTHTTLAYVTGRPHASVRPSARAHTHTQHTSPPMGFTHYNPHTHARTQSVLHNFAATKAWWLLAGRCGLAGRLPATRVGPAHPLHLRCIAGSTAGQRTGRNVRHICARMLCTLCFVASLTLLACGYAWGRSAARLLCPHRPIPVCKCQQCCAPLGSFPQACWPSLPGPTPARSSSFGGNSSGAHQGVRMCSVCTLHVQPFIAQGDPKRGARPGAIPRPSCMLCGAVPQA